MALNGANDVAVISLGLENNVDTGVVPSPTAPIIAGNVLGTTLNISVLVTAQYNEGYKVYIKEGAGAYARWPDDDTIYLDNSIQITGLTIGSEYTVKLAASNDTADVDSNEITVEIPSETFTQTKSAIIAWIRYATGYDAGHVFWDQQDMPRPPKPYITVRLDSFDQIGQEYRFNPNASGESVTVDNREFTLAVSCFSTRSIDPLLILLQLHSSLQDRETYKILQDADIAYVDDLSGPSNITTLLDSKFEPRAMFEILLRIPWSITDTAEGVIESVVDADAIYKIGTETIFENTINIP